MKKIFFVILITILALTTSLGCSKINNSNSEKQLADSIVSKLQTQDKINLTEQESQYVEIIRDKIFSGEELNQYEKLVNEQFGKTDPKKFLPKTDVN